MWTDILVDDSESAWYVVQQTDNGQSRNFRWPEIAGNPLVWWQSLCDDNLRAFARPMSICTLCRNSRECSDSGSAFYCADKTGQGAFPSNRPSANTSWIRAAKTRLSSYATWSAWSSLPSSQILFRYNPDNESAPYNPVLCNTYCRILDWMHIFSHIGNNRWLVGTLMSWNHSSENPPPETYSAWARLRQMREDLIY